jgi:hypothetical protein
MLLLSVETIVTEAAWPAVEVVRGVRCAVEMTTALTDSLPRCGETDAVPTRGTCTGLREDLSDVDGRDGRWKPVRPV